MCQVHFLYIKIFLISAQIGVLRGLNDLAIKASELKGESRIEQKSAGLFNLNPFEFKHFVKYNTLYKVKFGFPFIICARRNMKEEIMNEMEIRIDNPLEDEIKNALHQVKMIAALRVDLAVKKLSLNSHL